MRVQLKKKRGKVCIANLISANRLPNAAGGLGGAVRPPEGPGLSPGGGQGGEAPRKFHLFSSKNALDWLILSLEGQLRYAKFFRPTAQPCLTIG